MGDMSSNCFDPVYTLPTVDALKEAVDIAPLDDNGNCKISAAEDINKIEQELMELPIAGRILRSMIGNYS